MSRKKWTVSAATKKQLEKSLVGKDLLGSCLKTMGSNDYAIEQLLVNIVAVKELETVKTPEGVFVDVDEVIAWVNTPEGARWAFPKEGRRKSI